MNVYFENLTAQSYDFVFGSATNLEILFFEFQWLDYCLIRSSLLMSNPALAAISASRL
jgi:hypothetical protein